MIEIDGVDGGGQLLRTSLALSVISGEAARISNIRGSRSNPGLRPQHLTVVSLFRDLADASVSEIEIGSDELEFDPGMPGGGSYEASIGTAGSITLLFDAILPLATVLEQPATVIAHGGTDVKWSPPFDFFRSVKLPLLRRFGIQAAVELERWGFYPEGGGEARLHLAPSDLATIRLEERDDLQGARLYSKCSTSLADRGVADRQLSAAGDRLADRDVSVIERNRSTAETRSPGSALTIRLDFANTVAGFDSLGEQGKPAETVGEEAADRALAFLGGSGAVDVHLGDQLLVFLALTDGRIAVPTMTEHIETSLDLVEAFGLKVPVTEGPGGQPVLGG